MNAPTRPIGLDLNSCDAKTGGPKVAERPLKRSGGWRYRTARRSDSAGGAIPVANLFSSLEHDAGFGRNVG
jgi:hypothetical protein